eukprot:6268610-Prymnesium_polylepis.1
MFTTSCTVAGKHEPNSPHASCCEPFMHPTVITRGGGKRPPISHTARQRRAAARPAHSTSGSAVSTSTPDLRSWTSRRRRPGLWQPAVSLLLASRLTPSSKTAWVQRAAQKMTHVEPSGRVGAARSGWAERWWATA